MNIPCNVGGGDKAFRLLAGGRLLYTAMPVPVSSIGVGIAFATAMTGYCPLNQLMKVSTCRVSETSNVQA